MEDHELILAREFCTHHQVEMNFIYSLKEYGLVEIITSEGNDYVAADRLNELEKIIRLHYDLDINVEGIDVILHLLKELEQARADANELRNRLRIYQ